MAKADQVTPAAATGRRPLRDQLSTGLAARLVRAVVTGSHAQHVKIAAPYTGEVLVELPQSVPGDVQLAFERARKAQARWAAKPVAERAAVMYRFHDLLLAHREELLDLIQAESGKARWHAFEEFADTVTCTRHYARRVAGYLRPRRRGGALPLLTRTAELRQPVGVVGIISPWNFPLSLPVTDAVPAFLAGNAVVLKPDNQTVLAMLRARELMIQSGLDDQLWQVVAGDGPVIGPALIDHADHVAFTGSTRTGRQVAQQAAYGLTGSSLELGGKNPLIVLDDADLDRTVEGAVAACFSAAGQSCVTTERIYVRHEIYREFTERFAERVRRLSISTGLDYSGDLGSLTVPRQLEQVTAHVEDAKAKGAKVLAGGRHRPDLGPLCYEPTVLIGVNRGMRVCREETFGPVVSVYPVKSDEDAVLKANDTEYGLNASVWTKNTRRGRAVAARIRAGSVGVNDGYAAAWGSSGAPMGGMGQSGLGRRHGAEGIWRYTEAQTIAVQRLLPIGPVLGLGYRGTANLLTGVLRALRALRAG